MIGHPRPLSYPAWLREVCYQGDLSAWRRGYDDYVANF